MDSFAIGAYPTMEACIAEWVTPLLGEAEAPDAELAETYDRLFPAYADARRALEPVWDRMARYRWARRATMPARPAPFLPTSRWRRPKRAEAELHVRTNPSASPFVDLFVIGGGINGAGIARDAAGRGLSVVLCEKDDLAEGTSSRSGKLVHGGLRYLEYYEFRLVREALIEREVLLNAAPPHHLADALRAAAQPRGPPGLAGAARPVPLRPSRRPQEAARHPHARPARATPRARRSSTSTRAASNIPTAGSTMPASWS